jgi:hypothetical protein
MRCTHGIMQIVFMPLGEFANAVALADGGVDRFP